MIRKEWYVLKDDLHMHRALKYAADMKKLEEQGRILILPCPLGSLVYIIRPKCDNIPFEECSNYECDGKCPYAYEYDVEPTIFDCSMLYQLCNKIKYILNENVFLDMDSAREKIKELNANGERINGI